MVVGSEFVAQCHPGCGIDRVREKEDQRSAEKVPEIPAFALTGRQLPQQREDDADGYRPDEHVGTASSPARAGVIGNVAHHRVGDGVGQAGQGAQQPDERGTHPQAEIQHDQHPADRVSQRVVDECAQAVDDLLHKRNSVFGRRCVVGLLAHFILVPSLPASLRR